jgi:hypothetical protein
VLFWRISRTQSPRAIYDSESDTEPEDKDPSDILKERGEWTHDHIPKPRILTTEALQFDPLYTGNILKLPEVKIIDASNHKSLFLNINRHGHRSGDYKKDCKAFEKGIKLFCLSGDSMFCFDARVTDSKKKHIRQLVEEGIPGAVGIFHTTTCTPGASEENSM